MGKADNNKELGAEKAPILTEEQGVEITPEVVAELKAKNTELESENSTLSKSLEEKENNIEMLNLMTSQLEKTVEEKDIIIEEQKTKIAHLNKSIVDFGLLYSKEKEVELPKEGEVLIRFLLSPAGKFKLPYNVGQEVALHVEVAAEIVEARYAEYVLEKE